jgi:hypothetical protein
MRSHVEIVQRSRENYGLAGDFGTQGSKLGSFITAYSE